MLDELFPLLFVESIGLASVLKRSGGLLLLDLCLKLLLGSLFFYLLLLLAFLCLRSRSLSLDILLDWNLDLLVPLFLELCAFESGNVVDIVGDAEDKRELFVLWLSFRHLVVCNVWRQTCNQL